MNKTLKVSYDPNGSGDSYGIRVKGNIETFFKLLLLIIKRGCVMPLDSHHGTYFYFEDYKMVLNITMRNWSHDNNGEGKSPMTLVFHKDQWQTILNDHGYTYTREERISKDMKKGLFVLLKRSGYDIVDQWNHESESSSISIVVIPEVLFTSEEAELYKGVLVKELQSLSEVVDVIS